MIQYNPKKWFQLIFHSYSRQVVKYLFPGVIIMSLYSTAVSYVVIDLLEIHYRSTTAVHSLLGIVLGLFLVFRTNTAYDRWWEGRKQWGLMVNVSRNLSVKLEAFLEDTDKDSRQFFARMIPNFVQATKEHLRKGVILEEMVLTEGEQDILKKEHIPNHLVLSIQKRINSIYRKGKLTGEHLLLLDLEMNHFLNIVGACERIKNTPIPYAYSMYIKKFIFIYVMTLPLGLVTQFEYWTVPVVILIFFTLFTIELIAEEIEDPFGRDVNDLPLDGLSHKIRRNVREILLNMPDTPANEKIQ